MKIIPSIFKMAIHWTNARVHHLVNVKYLYNLRERYSVVKHILWKGFKGESSLSFHFNQVISKVGSTFLTIFLNASGYKHFDEPVCISYYLVHITNFWFSF